MTEPSGAIPPELVRAYEETLFIIYLADRDTITCEVGKPPSAPLPAATVTVITAWNPGLERPNDEDNRAANRRLERELIAQGYEFSSACGRSRDGTHEEASFAIFDVSADDAARLGRRFGQSAVFWAGKGQGMLVWC